jgi:hypothetical protein
MAESRIFFVELPPEIQKQYGYDPARAAELMSQAAMKQKARAADLMSQAESALRTSEFGKGAELLNQVVSEYPTSRQAQTVYDIRAVLREKEQTQSGPLTASEAQRLGSLMDALANIKKDYRTPPEKRHDLEAVFGAETFRDTDNDLDSVSSSSRKLRNSVGKARGEY